MEPAMPLCRARPSICGRVIFAATLIWVIGSLGVSLAWAQPGPVPSALVGHSAPVNSAIFTPNQQYVISGGADQTIKLWDAATGKEIRSLAGHTGPVLSLGACPCN